MAQVADDKEKKLSQAGKFHRPPVVDGFVERRSLAANLNHNQRPLTLVVAPPGYGKTTFASHCAETAVEDTAWISLTAADNDFRKFLDALAWAWRDLYPRISKRLGNFAEAEEEPTARKIVNAIGFELEDEPPASILVLDDYHNIRDPSVHDLVDSLLEILFERVRVFIVGRSSPPLRLGRLRTENKVADIRQRHLQFTQDETLEFVRQRQNADPSSESVGQLQSLTEGWPAGLQLVLLAAEGQKNADAFIQNITRGLWQIETYLIEELLEELDDDTRSALLRLALLDRFCKEMIDAIISPAGSENPPIGELVMETMRTRGMFLVPLDAKEEWVRFHHLFGDLLRRRAQETWPTEEIRATKKRAATWLEQIGEIELAVEYYVDADEMGRAADLVNTHGTEANNRYDTRYAADLLSTLPQEIINKHFGLLLLQGYCSMWAGRYTMMVSTSEALEQLASNDGDGIELSETDRARMVSLRHNAKWLSADFQEIIAEDIVLPREYGAERTSSMLLRSTAQLLVGDSNRARADLHAALEASESEEPAHRVRVMIGLCFFHWFRGELLNLITIAEKLRREGIAHANDFAVIYALWFKAAAEFFLNDLDAARETLRPVERRSWWPHQYSYVNCVRISAAVYRAAGDFDQAEKITEALVSNQVEANSTARLPEVLASRADNALAAGHYADAYNWAQDFEVGPVNMPHGFSEPSMSAARILLRQGSREAVDKAGKIIAANEAYFSNIYANRFVLELIILRAMYLSKTGEVDAAVAKMTDAVLLARPAQNLRIFADFGLEIAPLLNRVDLSDGHLRFIGRILSMLENELNGRDANAAPRANNTIEILSSTLEPLSRRETEVLALLAERMTNREIGEKLYISPATVKRHTHNIYGKLGVSSRKAAVAKATGIGIV